MNDGTVSAATFDYDNRNRLEAATLPGSQAYGFTYNDADELIDKIYPNGLTTTHTYQANGPVTGITTNTVQDLQYTYDAVLNIDTQSDNDGLHDYGYDGLDRLTSAVRPGPSPLPDESYAYDPVGNREDPTDNTLYDYDANHRIQASPGLTYTFDADGNTITRSDGAGFSYDQLDRLTQYAQSAITASYAYNPRNQRIRKTVDGATTWFLWSEGILLAEYDGAGQRTRRYDTLPGDYLPAQMEAAGVTLHIHGDHLQTPREITDDTGTVVWTSRHEAFGAIVVDDDPDGDTIPVIFHHRFPGQFQDEESGLYYNWNRYFDPSTGRYITSDPIGLDGGLNTYVYVDNNPARWTDLTGLAKFCCRLLNSFVGSVFGQRHCYVVADGGTVYGLYPENGVGVPRTNDPRDQGGECFDCPAVECENQNECLRKAHRNYPVGSYSSLGPNSNTYAGTLARSCCEGGVPAGVGNAPGINSGPPVPDSRAF